MKRVQKYFSIVLAVILLLTAAPLSGFVGLEWPDIDLPSFAFPEINLPDFDFNLSADAAGIVKSGSCGENLTWRLDRDGVLIIAGTGEMKNYSSPSSVPWYSNRSAIKVLSLSSSITNIGDYAFYGCNNLKTILVNDLVVIQPEEESSTLPEFPEEPVLPDEPEITTMPYEPDPPTDPPLIEEFNEESQTIAPAASYFAVAVTDPEAAAAMPTTEAPVTEVPTTQAPATEAPITSQDPSFDLIDSDNRLPDSVTRIGDWAFYNCTSLTSVAIPDSVTRIGNGAFSGCTSLTSVTIPDSVTSIGGSAFEYCESLTAVHISDIAAWCNIDFDSAYANPLHYAHNLYLNGTLVTKLTIPDSVTSIGDFAFRGCTSLTSVTIPDSVTSIGYSAFYSCTSLTSVTIGNSVTSIRNYAFEECTSLTSVTIPDSVTSIGDYAFCYCTSLTDITVDADNTKYCSEDGVLFNKRKTELIQYPIGNARTSYTIPDGVTSIGEYAFAYCTKLTSVTIPDSVTSIGGAAFGKCTSLTSVTIPDSVTSIRYYTFSCCISLTSVTIGDSVTSIENSVFSGCTKLTSVTIPDSVISIGKYAFFDCDSLEGITIPNSTGEIYDSSDTIDDGAVIYGYTNSTAQAYAEKYNRTFVALDPHTHSYTGTVTLAPTCCTTGVKTYTCECEDSYTEVIPFDFTNHTGGTEVRDAKAPTSTEEGYTGDTYCLGCNTKIANGESIPYTPEIIASGTCGENLTWTLDDAGTLTISGTGKMENYNYWNNYSSPWFSNRTSVKKIVIENGVTSIGEYAFYYCTSLTSVTIGDSVTSIGKWAFEYCTSLTSVTIGDSVTSIGDRAFCNCTSLTEILVDADNTTYCSEDGVLFNKSKTELIQYPVGNARTSYTIPDSVTSIGYFAFFYCTSLTSVIIPDSVTSIVSGAFAYCDSLTSVTIPDSVTSIGNDAFSDCTSLTSVTIPDSVTSIGYFAFYNCISLTSVHISDIAAWCNIDFGGSDTNPLYYAHNLYINGTLVTTLTIPDSVTSIGDAAFAGCTSLTSVTIGDSVTSIGNSAFDGCTSLTSVTIGDIVTSIGNYAFDGCTSLTSVTIPDSVTSIGWSAFRDCTSLTSVTIPDSVTSIGWDAFYNCTKLTSVTILNPACEIYDTPNTIYPGATICGYTGSTAEAYATKYNLNFVPLTDCQHTGGTADCQTKAKCDRCGQEYGDFGAHVEGSYTQPANCTVNGYTRTFCEICGEEFDFVMIPAAHTPGPDATCTTGQTCTVCGEVLAEKLGHAEENHDEQPATCTEHGYTSGVYCTRCKTWLSGHEVIDMLDHTWSEWFVVTAATFTIEGLRKRTCTVCSAEESEIIPILETKEFEDKDSGISVETDKDAYGGKDVEVKVEEVFDGSHYLGQSFGKYETWNIKTYVDGEQAQPDTPVYVRIPLPEGFNKDKIHVYHINSQTNEREKMDAEIIDGYICFYTSSFSIYIVVDESSLVEASEVYLIKPYTIAEVTDNGIVVTKADITVADLLAASNATDVLTTTGAKADATAKLSTGMQLVILDGETVVDSMQIAVQGDVDLNCNVDSSDARLALRAAVKLETLTEAQTKAADADKNGEIEAADARLILRAAVGLGTL